MSTDDRDRILGRIRAGIASVGHHVTLVQGGRTPRFAYSIGLTETGRPEVVLPGATVLTGKAVKRVLDGAVKMSREGSLAPGATVTLPEAGSFVVSVVHPSWADRVLLGALDLYGADSVTALQLVPDATHRTIDVPDMSQPWDPARAPVWRWLVEPWDLPFSPGSVAVTNLDALFGEPISEAARWEDTEWEMFAGAGPDVPPDAVRVVPLATLLGFDPSLEPVTRLEVGQALRRDPGGEWQRWETRH